MCSRLVETEDNLAMVVPYDEMDALIRRLERNELETWSLKGPLTLHSNDQFDRLVQALEGNTNTNTNISTSLHRLHICDTVHKSRYGLSPCFSTEQAQRFFNAVANLKLTSLEITAQWPYYGDLSNTSLLTPLVSKNQHLTSLLLTHCIRITSLQESLEFQTALQGHATLRRVELRSIQCLAHCNAEPIPRLDPILKALRSIPHLNAVSLGCSPGTQYFYLRRLHTSEALAALASKEGESLRVLDLHHLRVNDHDLEVLAQSLGPTMESLTLSTYQSSSTSTTTTTGLEQLVTRLLPFESLRRLVIQDDGIRPQQPPSSSSLDPLVLPLMERNYHIQALELPCTTPQQLDLYLRLNRAGRQRLREPKTSTADWIRLLHRVSTNPDALFYVLTKSPGFLSL
jgi:hypothetical protein